MIHVLSYFESTKKRLVKHTPLSKGNPLAAVQKADPKVPNSTTSDKVSENLGPNITTDCSNPTRSAVSNPVIDSDSLDPNNGREDFLEKIEEIDKDMGRFELSEIEVLEPKLTTLSKGRPNLDPSVLVMKPARWTRIVRPISSHEDNCTLEQLGKCSNSFSTDEHPLHKCKTQDAKPVCEFASSTAVADVQPRRVP